MYVKVKVKCIGKLDTEIKIDLPSGTLNDNDSINNIVRNYLKNNGVKYFCYKILSIPNFPLQYASDIEASLPYDVIVIDEGNGEWFHGDKNPLQHKWHIYGNRAICLVCRKVIEKQFSDDV